VLRPIHRAGAEVRLPAPRPARRRSRWNRSSRSLAAAAALLIAARGAAATDDARIDALAAAAPRIDRQVLRLALTASDCAAARDGRAATRLAVIDYSHPSTEPRLWVFDLERRTLLFEELVAHGRNSGEDRSRAFSNHPGSRQTSLGLFRTADLYAGRSDGSAGAGAVRPCAPRSHTGSSTQSRKDSWSSPTTPTPNGSSARRS
jgi:hypothetical protein